MGVNSEEKNTRNPVYFGFRRNPCSGGVWKICGHACLEYFYMTDRDLGEATKCCLGSVANATFQYKKMTGNVSTIYYAPPNYTTRLGFNDSKGMETF